MSLILCKLLAGSMSTVRCAIVACVVFTIFLPWTDCLICYQCGSVGQEGYCKKDIKDLWKSADKVLKNRDNMTVSDDPGDAWKENEVNLPYVKQCGINRTVCMIEEIINSQTDFVLSYIRDCSDGKSFSYANLTLLQNLNTNNFTTCAYDVKGYLICITLCTTDFCNGPHAHASLITQSILLQVLALVGVHFMKMY